MLPEVSGYRVSKVLVDVGDVVKQGQTLVQLDPALVQAQLAQAVEAVASQAAGRRPCRPASRPRT